MTVIHAPTVLPARKWKIWLLAPAAALGAMLAYWAFIAVTAPKAVVLDPSRLFNVALMDLDVRVQKDGELQAVNNIEVVSLVEGQTTVQTLVAEGTVVKKGDVLITLDSSAIKQKIEDSTLEIQKAEADLLTAKEMREIQISQNSANLESADVALLLAKIDFKAYEEGGYPQQLKSAASDLEMARITLKNKQEDLAQTRALFAKGFVTAADIKKYELDFTTAQAAVDKTETAHKVLTLYTHQKDAASFKNALSQAEQKLVRTRRENASNLAQKEADVDAKTLAFGVLKRRMEKLHEQLAACTITAPADGLLVYASSNDRNAQAAMAEGSQIRERQLLFRLPDTTSMKAAVRINEAQVSKLSVGMRARVQISGQPRPIGATLTRISVLPDNSQRFWNPDLKEYPVDLELDETPKGIKPGVGCLVDVLVDRAEKVIAVPLTAVYSAGMDNFVFVNDGNQYKPVKVSLKRTNATHAEITDGLSAGQDVLILQVGEGQSLLEKAGIKPTPVPQDKDDRQGGRRRGGNGNGGGPKAPDGGIPGAAPGLPSGPGAQQPVESPGPPSGGGTPRIRSSETPAAAPAQ